MLLFTRHLSPSVWSTPCCLILAAAGTLLAQQPVTPLQLDVPIKDAPPTLTLPLPKPFTGLAPSPAPMPATPPQEAIKGGDLNSGLPGAEKKPELPANFKPIRSSSTSGQFVLHGTDLATRTWFSQRMESIAEDLRRVLRDPQPWSLPIVVSIKTPPDIDMSQPAVKRNISELNEGGFHLQLTAQMQPDFNTSDLKSEAIVLLLAERILRDHKQMTTKRSRILPNWLLVGITEAMQYRERSKPSALFAAVFKSGKVYGIEEILEVSPGTLDAMSRTIYEVSACALVLALVEQPEGGMRMSKFLSALAVDNRSDRELINQWFPGIAQSKSSLDKWWSLQMANLSRPSVFESLDPTESAKALDQAMMLRFNTEADNAPVIAASKPAAERTESEAAAAEADAEAHAPGLISRLFGRKDAGKGEEPTKDTPPAPPPAATASKVEPTEEQVMPTQRHGLLSKFFGTGGDKKDAEADATGSEPPAPAPEKKAEPTKKEKAEAAAIAKPEPKPKPKAEPKKEEPKAEKKAEPKKAETAPPPADEEGAKKKPFFGRLFGSGAKPADEEAAPEPAADKKSKKEATPAPAAKPDAKGKGKDKDAEKKTSAQSTNLQELLLRAVADLTVPAAGWVYQAGEWLDAADGDVASARATILGFGKKKKAEDEAPAEEPAKAAAPAKKQPAKAAEPAKGKEKAADKDKEKEKALEAAAAASAAKKKEASAAEAEAPAPKPAPKPAAPKRKAMVPVALPLSEYARVMKRSDAHVIFDNTTKELISLSRRAHPLFRPIVAEYVALVTEISKGKAKNVDERLKELAVRRAEILKVAKAVQDHLDWYEASENDKWSGMFDDYLRVPKMVEEELPQRTDPFSKMLDEAEKGRKGQ